MNRILKSMPVFLVLSIVSFPAVNTARAEGELTATEIMEKSQESFYYQGEDMKAKVSMGLIDKNGKTRSRVMTMLRMNDSEGGNQKFFIYFHEPGDVKNMTFMVWKYLDKEDDRWIYIPAVDLIRRIASDDKRSSFVGSDFTYEDISGRGAAADDHTLLRTEKLGESDCYVIESIPKEKTDHVRRLSWIDIETMLPLKEEYYDAQNAMFRVFTADHIETVSTFPTVMKRTMSNLKTGHRTVVTFRSISYNLGLEEGDFSERHLRRPPRSWIK